MEKLKSFKQFLNEKMMDNFDNVQDVELNDEIVQDEFVQDEIDFDNEPEEITDILELTYNKKNEEWLENSELDLPYDFDNFYDWFVDMDEDNTLASMKEDDDEVVFYIPEDLYIEYLESQKDLIKNEPEEESFDDDDDDDDDDWDDNQH